MSRCIEFYEKWQREPNWCEKCPSAVSQINSYIELIEKLEQKGVSKEFTIVKLPEGAARPLFQEKDSLVKEKAIDAIKKCLKSKKNPHNGRFIKKFDAVTVQKIITQTRNKVKNQELKKKVRSRNIVFIPESLQFYNVWSFLKRNPRYGLYFESAIPGQIVENVLYYYSKQGDTVVDVMAGGGTTIDVCEAMNRRCLAYDKNPMREDILQHDLMNGFPKETKGADLIFLDPPYFDIISDIQDFKDYDEFCEFEQQLAKESFKNVRNGGIVTYLIQDLTQKHRLCLSGDAYKIFTDAGFRCIDHISCPLSTQQFNLYQVTRSKKNKRMLGRNRDLYIFCKE